MNPKDNPIRKQRQKCRLLRMPAIWEKGAVDLLASGDCTPDQRKDLFKDIVLKEDAKTADYARKLTTQQYKMENKQMFQRIQQEKEERTLQDCLCKTEKDKCKRDAQICQETNFAVALERFKDENTCKEAMRRQIRNDNPEIRELERQIRRAYYAKTLYAQRLEGEVQKLETKVRDMEINEIMIEHIKEFDKQQEAKQEEECARKREYMRTLKMQIESKLAQMKLEKQDDYLDKQMVDEIMETIKQEELNDLHEQLEKRKLYVSEMDAARRARDDFRQKEKERQEEEERQRREYLAQKKELAAKLDEARTQREARKADIAAATTQRILEEQYKRAEFEELQHELIQEELAEQVRRKEAEEAAAREKARQELQKAAAEAMRLREEKMEMEKKENEEFRKMMMAKFADDERLEQLSNQKRREKEREHRKRIEEMILERRARKADEREREQAITKCLENLANNKEIHIEQERLRLLREHGPKLLGFLPRGLIKKEDIEKLGEPFVTYYANIKRIPDPTTVDLYSCEEEEYLQSLSISKTLK